MVQGSDEQNTPAPYPSDAAWKRVARANLKDQNCELPAATVGLFPNIWEAQIFWNPDPNMPPMSHPLPPRPDQLHLLGDQDMRVGEARLSPGYVSWYLPCQETLVQVLFTTPKGYEYRVLEWLDGQGLLSEVSYAQGWSGHHRLWVGAETREELDAHFLVSRQGHYTTSWTMVFRAWEAWMAQQGKSNALAQQQAEGRRCRLVLRLSDALSDYPEPDRFLDRLWVAAGEYGLVSIHWWAPRYEARRVIDSQGPRWERPARPNAMEIDCAQTGGALQYSDRQAEVLPGRTRWRLCVPVNERNEVAGSGVLSFTADRRFTIEESDAFEHCAGFLERALRGLDERVLMDHQTTMREDELKHSLNALRQEVERTRKNEATQSALFQIARLASEHAHSSNFNERVHAILGGLVRADTFAMLLSNPQPQKDNGKHMSLVYLKNAQEQGEGGDTSDEHSRLAIALAHQATQRRAPIFAKDPKKSQAGETWLAAPLLDEGKAIGALCLRGADGYGHQPGDLDVLALCAQQVAHAISRQRAVSLLEARVAERTHDLRQQQAIAERQALHDPLTDLPNRRHLEQKLTEALSRVEEGKPMALMFLDLDYFKAVNDEYGHAAGDLVLMEASQRMRDGIRPSDFVARLSGDEFIILIQPAGDKKSTQTMADRLCAAVSVPVLISKDKKAQVGCSIGWTMVTQSNEMTPQDLLERADEAMYAAKRGGRGRAVSFDIKSSGVDHASERRKTTQNATESKESVRKPPAKNPKKARGKNTAAESSGEQPAS